MKSEKGEILEMFIIGFVIALIIGITTVLISAIASNIEYGEKEGVIIDKRYRNAYTTIMYIPTGKVLLPTTQYYPEKWEIQIKKEVDGKERNTWTSIDENTYNNLKIGDYFKETE